MNDTETTGKGRSNERVARQRGSAMVIAMLVTVIMTLLGVAFLLMAETENRIAQNEKLAAQALYFAEAGTRQVKRWFDRPLSSPNNGWNLDFPAVNAMRRDLRLIDVDGPGPTAPVLTDGNASGAQPYYKQGVDLDANGIDDLFDKPYRPAILDMFLGTEAGPDIRIRRSDSTEARTFLDGLSEKLLADFPASGAGIRARLETIDLYAPPYIKIGVDWVRYGITTVRVTAQIIKTVGSTEQVLAQRSVRAVLNETPYPGPFGPLQSCDQIDFNGEFKVHWGPATAVGDSDVPNNLDKIKKSIPRAAPPNAKIDLLHGYNDPAVFATLKASLETGKEIQDPWFRFLSGGPIVDTSALPSPQPYAPSPTDQDHSNIFQNQPGVTCPEFEYELWREISRSGGSDVHYFTWVADDIFQESGYGPQRTFENSTAGKTGLFFFDTRDRSAPRDTNSDKFYENLTPPVRIQGGSYNARGFIYLNSEIFTANGSPGAASTFTMPGEPYVDTNGNGRWDSGESWVNLNYNSLADLTSTIRGSATDAFPLPDGTGPAVYNKLGKAFTADAMLWGLLYTNGELDSQGSPRVSGSIVTKTGQTPSAGTFDIYWDQNLVDNWPPPGWDLPRVVVTRWETDVD